MLLGALCQLLEFDLLRKEVVNALKREGKTKISNKVGMGSVHVSFVALKPNQTEPNHL